MKSESQGLDIEGNNGRVVEIVGAGKDGESMPKDVNAIKAEAFWRWRDHEESAIDVVKTKMAQDIEEAVLEGTLTVVVSKDGTPEQVEQDENRLAAYNMIARDLKCNLGKFEIQKGKGKAIARIERD